MAAIEDGGDARPVDGRTARALRTRQAIVDACVTLIDEGDLSPTAPRVAERAGVSVRSVFQHFDDLDGLYAAVGDRVLERLVGLILRVDPALDPARRIPIVVRQRAALLEALTPIRRAAFINAWNSVEVSSRMRSGQAFLRAEVAAVFAGEIAEAGDGGAELLIAVDTLLSWANWDHLRATVGLSHDESVDVVERMVRAVLAAYW